VGVLGALLSFKRSSFSFASVGGWPNSFSWTCKHAYKPWTCDPFYNAIGFEQLDVYINHTIAKLYTY